MCILSSFEKSNKNNICADILNYGSNNFPCALYADHLSDALTDQVSLLRNLESLLETRSNHLQSTINLLGDLQITTNRIQQLVLDCVFLLLLLYVYVWERWRYTCFYLFVHN